MLPRLDFVQLLLPSIWLALTPLQLSSISSGAPPAPPMSGGRGRGVNVNKPAWLVAKEREEAEQNAAAGGIGGGSVSINGDTDVGKFANAAAPTINGGNNTHGGEQQRDQFGRVIAMTGERNGGSGNGGGDSPDNRGGHRDDNRRRDDHRRRDHRDRRGGGDERGGSGRHHDRHRDDRGKRPASHMRFRSYEEERDWLDDRRRGRRSRRSRFDVEPTPEQLAEDEARAVLESLMPATNRTGGLGGGPTGANVGLNAGGGPKWEAPSSSSSLAVQPQQTRHARRLYVGNIPDLSEDEVHTFFRNAIRDSIILDPATNPNAASQKAQYVDNDPIISVYINRERRFVFLEFKTMEITSACLALDGIDVMGQGKVKVKRPNDYNAALAPPINSPLKLDIARLGIVSPTVPDGPNKIFVGGLPYHLNESQVLELLGAFGPVKAFHLVKQDNNAVTSKGYCFVEYSDPNITQIACMGLNGMDMGGGKQLSCRMAAQQFSGGFDQGGGGSFGATVAALPAMTSVVDGFDVDALLAQALGGASGGGMAPMTGGGMMPGIINPAIIMQQQQQQQQQQMMGMYGGMMAQQPQMLLQQQQQQHQQPQMLISDPMAVANAAADALDAAFGGGGTTGASMALQPVPLTTTSIPTRVLVLLNMVMDDDLATDDDHKMLEEEVREEVSRYGKLISMKIPRPQVSIRVFSHSIFLRYVMRHLICL